MTPALFPRAAAHLTDVLLLAASSCTAAVYAILVGDLDPGFAEGVIVDNVCGEDRWVVEIPRDQRTPTVRTLDVSSNAGVAEAATMAAIIAATVTSNSM